MRCEFSVFSLCTVQLKFLYFTYIQNDPLRDLNPSFTAIDNVMLSGWK